MIFDFFRRRESLPLCGSDIKEALGTDIAISPDMAHAILFWDSLYRGDAPWLCDKVKSLGLAAAISSEFARLVTMEMRVLLSGGERAAFLQRQIDSFLPDMRRYAEYACAKGGLVMKPYVEGGRVLVDFIQADRFFPTAFDSSGKITGAVFCEQLRKGGEIYTRLEIHDISGGGVRIRNRAYKSRTAGSLGVRVCLDEVLEWSSLLEEFHIETVSRPLFAYFKMPLANTIDPYSPLGVSVFSRAAGLIEEADRQFGRLLWEFESGERALYVDTAAFRRDKNGKPILPDKRLYRTVDSATGDLFEDFSPTLRDSSILNGLNTILMRIEDACSLARGTFSNADTQAKTATELKIMRQRTYAAVSDTQKALEAALSDLICAMDVWTTLFRLAPDGGITAAFDWDDSIASDRDRAFDEMDRLLSAGVITSGEFRAWYFGRGKEV